MRIWIQAHERSREETRARSEACHGWLEAETARSGDKIAESYWLPSPVSGTVIKSMFDIRVITCRGSLAQRDICTVFGNAKQTRHSSTMGIVVGIGRQAL